MSNFYGLEVARKSLYASQRAIELTGHNIANANTEGYTRQRIDFQAVAPGIGSVMDNTGGNRTGGGVEIQSIVQVRNEYLDTLFRKENSFMSEMETKSDALRYIEDIFSESSGAGIASGIENLFSSMDQLSGDTNNTLLREQIKQNAITLTNTMNIVDNRLSEFVDRQNDMVESIVNEINSLAEKIGGLNKTIFNYELGGQTANDLRDTRNLMVDKLSSLVAVTVNEKTTGEFRVSVSGMALVDHLQVNNIVLKEEASPALDGKGILNTFWEDGGRASVSSGELKGILDIRDGNGEQNPGISYFMNKLDTLAQSMVENFNGINSGGYTAPYGTTPSRTGINFFDPANITAGDIKLSDEMMDNAANIAASGELIAGYDNWGNNENLQLFTELRDSNGITLNGENIGNYKDYSREIITEIGIAVNYNTSRAETQRTMVNYVESEKKSVSEVSLDEEMVNLIKYQHSYAAAAKLMTAVDEMISTLIHSLGTGGR